MMTNDLAPLESNATALADLLTQWDRTLSSVNTRRAYSTKVNAYMEWLDGYSYPALAATREHLDAYRAVLEEQGKSTATILATISALSSFYAYAVDRDLIPANPVAKIKRPKIDPDHTETTALSRDQARALMTAARDLSPRAHALVSVLLHTGLRVGELLAANVEDLGMDNGHHVLTVTRKGGKRGRVAIPPAAYAVLTGYLQGDVSSREITVSGQEGSAPLFTTATGKRMSDQEARRTVARLGASIGVERLSPHSLRHTFATTGLEAGAGLHTMQDALGHADPRTTRRYDHARNRLSTSPVYLVANVLGE